MKEKSKKVINILSIIYSSIIVFFCSIIFFSGWKTSKTSIWWLFINRFYVSVLFGFFSSIMCIIQFIYLKKKNKKYLKSLNIANLICAGLVIVFFIIYCFITKKAKYINIAPFIIIINVIFLFLAYAYIKMDDTPKLKSS